MFFEVSMLVLGALMILRQLMFAFNAKGLYKYAAQLTKGKRAPGWIIFFSLAYFVFCAVVWQQQILIGDLYTWPITLLFILGLLKIYVILFDYKHMKKLVANYIDGRKKSAFMENVCMYGLGLVLVYYGYLGLM